MSDYIDRDLLLAEIKELKKSPWYNGGYGTYERNIRREAVDIIVDLCIRSAPAADVQAVKHGKWKRTIPTPDSAYYCSVCGRWVEREDNTIPPQVTGFHYCPNCGAKMDGGKK